MSPFKTKKLPKKVREIPIISEKETPISLQTPSLIKRSFSPKIIVGWLIFCITVFFVSQLALRAFSGNEKYGSETFTQKVVVEEFVTQKVKGTTNILIAWIGGKGHDGGDLTDSIMLASLDEERNTVTLLSLPRDLYVAYPNGKGSWRINSLYDLGKRNKVGITYLADKVSEITWQTIDHYFVIDFAGFKDIINILGGISIDVPESILDREYPDNNWGYMTFQVQKGLQNFDGDTALKYARSRHSTSDFDRSNRQQLIIKWIKDKASELGIITDASKIGDIYTAIISHLDTDLSIAGMGEIALAFSDIQSDAIGVVSLSDSCLSLTKCAPGAYLYSPSRDLFGGNAVVIPENAQANKLSFYTDIRRFVDTTFRFPLLRLSPRNIVLISDPSMRRRTQEIGMGLAKLWFPISFEKSLIVATGSIEKSHVNIYWNADMSVGIDPSSQPIEALKYLEESLPYILVDRNEYANTSWPKIEIIIGKDGDTYLKELKSVYYIPAPPKNITSWEANPQPPNGEKKIWSWVKTLTNQKKPWQIVSWEKQIEPGEWENF